jgi:hypothetical protein
MHHYKNFIRKTIYSLQASLNSIANSFPCWHYEICKKKLSKNYHIVLGRLIREKFKIKNSVNYLAEIEIHEMDTWRTSGSSTFQTCYPTWGGPPVETNGPGTETYAQFRLRTKIRLLSMYVSLSKFKISQMKTGTMPVPRMTFPQTVFPRNGTNNFSPNDFSPNDP